MIFPGNEDNIKKGADILNYGGLVAFPTETVYGLGGNSLDPIAVAKIFAAKERPSFDPLITHIADFDMLDRLADIKDRRIYDIARHFWPGSLTLIVPRKPIVPDIVTSGLDTMAVRMPDHPVALELIRRSSGALAAPSANPFGYLSPTTAAHVEEGLGDRIDMVLDGGSCRVGVESTVLDMTRPVPMILRPGGISREELEAVIGKVDAFDRTIVTAGHGASSDAQSVSKDLKAPGQLEMHYSPRKSLHIVDSIQDVPPAERGNAGLLAFGSGHGISSGDFCAYRNLSENADVLEAAANLFIHLHELDSCSKVQQIYALRVPAKGLGRAVMDRIYKASVK